jgi:hypothetical protein
LVPVPLRTGTTVDGSGEGTTVERDANLVGPGGPANSDLDGLVPGATARVLPVDCLGATYDDTADLRLARSGIALRHDAGESGVAGTVRLPDEGSEATPAHREIRLGGSAVEVSEAAADPVRAPSRAAALPAIEQRGCRGRSEEADEPHHDGRHCLGGHLVAATLEHVLHL